VGEPTIAQVRCREVRLNGWPCVGSAQPAGILADEPTGNFDRVAAEEVLAALSETSDKGVADLYHDPASSTVAMLFWRSERGIQRHTYKRTQKKRLAQIK